MYGLLNAEPPALIDAGKNVASPNLLKPSQKEPDKVCRFCVSEYCQERLLRSWSHRA
jgi:hypothetical protein